MNRPLISCLMPTLNRRQFIPAAIKMWQAQDYPNKELIVIDDGESVRDLVDLADDERIRYYRFAGTLGAKLNFGARVAHGEVLLNWDDDDYNTPNRISQQFTHMQLTGKPFVGMSSIIFYEEGHDFGYEYIAPAYYASGSTHMYTREYALANPRPDMTVGEDNEAVKRAADQGALSTITGLTSLVARNHESNCSKRYDHWWLALHDGLKEAGLLDNYKRVPLDRFIDTINAARL